MPVYQDDGVFLAPNYASPSCTQNYEAHLIGDAITSEYSKAGEILQESFGNQTYCIINYYFCKRMLSQCF